MYSLELDFYFINLYLKKELPRTMKFEDMFFALSRHPLRMGFKVSPLQKMKQVVAIFRSFRNISTTALGVKFRLRIY